MPGTAALPGPSTWFPDTVETKQRRVSSILNGPRDYYFKIYEGHVAVSLKKKKKREKGKKNYVSFSRPLIYTFSQFFLIPYFDLFVKLKWTAVFLKWHLGTNIIMVVFAFFYCFFLFSFFTFSNDLKREHLSSTLCKMMKPQFAEKRYDLPPFCSYRSVLWVWLIHRGKFCVLGASPGRVLKKICLHLVVEAFCFDYFLVAFNHISRSEYLSRWSARMEIVSRWIRPLS